MLAREILSNIFQGGSLWAGLVSGGISEAQDIIAYSNGKMKANDFASNTTKNVTGAVGTMAGIEYGVVLGTTLLPGFGTVLGAVVGGIIGDRLGRCVGVQVGNIMFHNRAQMDVVPETLVDTQPVAP